MKAHPLKIVFFGSGAFGLPTLRALAERHELLAVVTQPDRPAGRKQRLTPTPIGEWAAAEIPKIPLLKPEDASSSEWIDRIRSFDTGIASERRGGWVVIAFGQKLSPSLLADRFAINLHASLLPRWRGAAPINRAVLAGDRETGNSVITLAERMDAGLVLGQSRRPIEPTRTAGELHDLLADDGPELIERVLSDYAADALNPVVQDEAAVTIARKLSKEQGFIDLASVSADEARRTIHALNPWPGVTVRFRGEALKLLRAGSEQPGGGSEPGTLIDPTSGTVACADNTALDLIEVQPAGKKPMAWQAFANGAKPVTGELLEAMGRASVGE